MSIKKVFQGFFKGCINAALSGVSFSGYDNSSDLHQMAVDSHLRAHEQAVQTHQSFVNSHIETVQHFNDFHMMGPHF